MKSFKLLIRTVLIYSLGILSTSDVLAIETSSCGYIAQSLIKSKGASFGGSNGNWSSNKLDIGLSSSIEFEHMAIRGAVNLKDENGLGQGDVSIRQLFVDLNKEIDNGNVGARIGKVRYDLSFYNETRSLPMISETIYSPFGIYREQFKNLASAGNGIQLYFEKMITEDYVYELSSTITRPDLSDNSEIVAGHFISSATGSFDQSKSIVKTFNVKLSSYNYDFDIRYDLTNLDFRLVPNQYIRHPVFNLNLPNPQYGTSRSDTMIHTIGIRKYIDHFDITGEYIIVKKYGDAWKAVQNLYQQNIDSVGYVMSLRYRPDSGHEYIVGFDNFGPSTWKNIDSIMFMTGLPRDRFYIRTKFVGANFKTPIDSVRVKVQYIEGDGTNALVQSVNTNASRKWNMLGFQVVYSF
jgi:hypothetical protein